MHKSFTSPVSLLAIGIILAGSHYSLGQQTPAPKPHATPTTRTRRAPTAKTQTAPALTTQKDKFSYALGMNLGTNLHKQSVPVDPNILLRGLKDALAGGKTALTEDQARAALMEVQNEMRKKQQEQMQVAGEASKKKATHSWPPTKLKTASSPCPAACSTRF